MFRVIAFRGRDITLDTSDCLYCTCRTNVSRAVVRGPRQTSVPSASPSWRNPVNGTLGGNGGRCVKVIQKLTAPAIIALSSHVSTRGYE